MALWLSAVVASIVTNPEQIARFDVVRSLAGDGFTFLLTDPASRQYEDVSTDVLKQAIFLASFVLLFYLIVSVIRTPAQIEAVVKTLVLGGSLVAVSALIERRTAFNLFDHLEGVVPGLRFADVASDNFRSGGLRVLGSAQHPIALAALFVVLLPLSFYLAYRERRARWWATSVVLAIAPFATVSRTAVIMELTGAVVFAVLRPSAVRRALPLVLPLLVAVHFVAPGAIGGVKSAFFPSSGLVEDQTAFGGRVSSKRLGPQFDVIKTQPLFGEGYGTRITTGPNANARILDDQWLVTAVETGLVGVAAWVWLFARFVRRAGREARNDESPRGWLLVALAASTVGLAVGMLTYDTFSFVQITYVCYMLLALGCSVIGWTGPWPGATGAKSDTKEHAFVA